jgi:glycosyltransferase involved in cell wall biosynthesis
MTVTLKNIRSQARKMVVIVMTYYQRYNQVLKTLESFAQYDASEFRVVIVDDCSPDPLELPSYPFAVDVIRISDKQWFNPAPVFNFGFNYALQKMPDKIVIQNAECYHYQNILGYLKNLTEDNYITFGCYSQGHNEPLGSVINNRVAAFNGDSAWYNHPIYRPNGYHFCSAITPNNLIKLNGFDERFAQGIAYDDDYFVNRIRLLGLMIEILAEPFVIHQWHDTAVQNNAPSWEENRKLYEQLIQEQRYRAVHIYSPDLK